MKSLSRPTQWLRRNRPIQSFLLPQRSFYNNTIAAQYYSRRHTLSRCTLHHQTCAFSTTPKDDSKSDAAAQAAESSSSTEATATSTENTSPSSSATPDASSTTDTSSNKKPEPRPLIHIHDEESPQLSIKLPNRWPFKRLAAKAQTPSEPLNLHEMTTFSGLPAQNFMPTEADKAKAEAQRQAQAKKSKEEKKREARIKFWKRYSMILLLTPIILYIMDNRKAKKLARRRAEYVCSASSADARAIREMAQLNNAQLIDLYHWILNEECDNDPDAEMTIDEFGKLFVRAVSIFKKRKEANVGGDKEKEIRLSREYDGELKPKDIKREVKWLTQKFESVRDRRLASKTKEIQAWDLHIFFTEYKLSATNGIPLKTLFTAISQITTDTLYNKAEIAFRIQGDQIEEEEPRMTYQQLVHLVEDMVITGHFTTDSLIIRRGYFPSQFGVRTAEEICDIIYAAAELDKQEDGMGVITFQQFGDALMTLAEGRRMMHHAVGFFLPVDFKPWCMVWYCSDRSKSEIGEEQRKKEREAKREEKRRQKLAEKAQTVTVDTNVDSDKGENEGDLQVQTN